MGDIWYGGLLVPHFFEGSVTGDDYLNVLRDTRIIWEHENGTPHYANLVEI